MITGQIIAAVLAFTAPPPCPYASKPGAGAPLWQMRSAVVCLVNRARRAHGERPLITSWRLNRTAQRFTQWMVDHHVFAHVAFVSRIDASGYPWTMAGENIASGYPTPNDVVTAWLDSPEHRANILRPGFRNVGTGELPYGINGAFGPGTWTQDFAAR